MAGKPGLGRPTLQFCSSYTSHTLLLQFVTTMGGTWIPRFTPSLYQLASNFLEVVGAFFCGDQSRYAGGFIKTLLSGTPTSAGEATWLWPRVVSTNGLLEPTDASFKIGGV